ncbi:Tyrosine-sulfated glycopeptide receptor 1 [Morella rubra]|uniref:Tyrosine-sulfated glycopeptide receptor 1 n=1 Tax=Morella rubra TaxID=262757 RepID=A0A6A1V6I2_9ROSI|nr:Tyrosine-sulfated glycopeptide receptor 1 [Morella rubra]
MAVGRPLLIPYVQKEGTECVLFWIHILCFWYEYQATAMVDLTSYGLFSTFALFLLFGIFSRNHACNQIDRKSLLSLPFNTSSPPLNWSSIDCCHWEGVFCDSRSQITHIWLPSKGLKGNISPSFGNLSRLSHLNLSHNSLSGSLPIGFLSSFNQLKVLDLSYNSLSGDISLLFSPNGWPASIQIVDLSSNRLHGLIQPSFLQQAWNLVKFNVSNNSFTGPIPSSLCTSSPFLKLLDFSSNDLSGQISGRLGGCSKLEIFRAGFNSFSGMLPHDIYNMTNLEEISLPSNNLSGPISNDIANLTKLSNLELYGNHLNGKLPVNIGKLSKLKYLLLYSNSLTGSLTPSLMNCTNLIKLNLRFNFLEGEISTLNFSSLQHLALLDLGRNNFTGHLPVSVYSWAIKSLVRCKTLSIVILTENFLHEALPADVNTVDDDGFKNLLVLGLAHCQMTGPIPSWFSTLPSLLRLDLTANLISGDFPKELCTLPALVSTKPQIDNISLILPIFAIVNGAFIEFSSLLHLRPAICLANNGLTGNIPVEIGRLKVLDSLDLSHNKFTGNIPDQISELTNLEYLNLSANQLSGIIPASLSSLHFLSRFSVTNNNLHGPIPSGTQLQSFDASAYQGNPGLCGAPLPRECQQIVNSEEDKDIQDEEDGSSIPWFHITVVFGFITGFWAVCGPLALNRNWRVAYFGFMDNVKDRLYMTLARLARLHRRL